MKAQGKDLGSACELALCGGPLAIPDKLVPSLPYPLSKTVPDFIFLTGFVAKSFYSGLPQASQFGCPLSLELRVPSSLSDELKKSHVFIVYLPFCY